VRTEKIAILLCIVLVILQFIFPAAVQIASPWLLALGLVFPGIPHGAVDHWLRLKQPQLARTNLLQFFGLYVFCMLSIAGLWWLSSLAGLVSFIIYSAWHFGETDLRDWQGYQPKLAWSWGLGVLLTLLFSHFKEFETYLIAYQINLGTTASSLQIIGLLAGFSLMALSLFLSTKKAFKNMAWCAAAIAISTFLPLLLAFAVYFIAGHSLRGWRHLQAETTGGFTSLLKMAMPFSVLAFVFLGLSLGLAYNYNWLDSNFWPLTFVFVAALSAPHVWLMHGFYTEKKLS
jgi:Brp/Blh family beta-carotene 15,15'-monooxygenase